MSENPAETDPPFVPENVENEVFDRHRFFIHGNLIIARKSVLARQSPVFRAAFNRPSTDIVLYDHTEITDVKFVVFDSFIEYLHTGSCPNIERVAVELLKVADRYRVEQLCRECEIEMLRSVNIYTAVHYLVVAIQLKRTKLANAIADFIKTKSPGIFEMNGWYYIAGNLDVMVEMIKLFSLKGANASRHIPHEASNEQNPTASNEVQSIPSSIPIRRNLSNSLRCHDGTVTWTLEAPKLQPSTAFDRELVSDVFFVIFPETDTLCGYNWIYQPFNCIQCRTFFAIAVRQISPKPNAKLRGDLAGKDCTLTRGCAMCRLCESAPMRMLSSGERGVEIVEYGRFNRWSCHREFTFTLSKLRGCQFNPNCRIVVNGESFICSIPILAKKSAYFSQLFQSRDAGTSYVLEDERVTPEDFQVIATYFANDRPPNPSKVNQAVLQMAKKFQLHQLFSVCVEILAQQVASNPSLAVMFFLVGHQTGATHLKQVAKHCIENNVEAILESEWKLLKDKPELLLELLMDVV